MNRKNLTAAVLAGLAGVAGIASTAQAVNINPDGTGQVLLYPYYTTNGGNVTLLSVVNTSDDAKAVKVRFMESENSAEVLDFNLYMSAYDVWTAAIEPMPVERPKDSKGDDKFNCNVDPDSSAIVPCEGPLLTVADDETTCTVPNLNGAQAFLPFQYLTVGGGDEGSQNHARMNEGHFEMIEMGTLITGETYEDADGNEHNIPSWAGRAATHVLHDDGSWAPEDCGALVDAWVRSKPFFEETSGVWINTKEFGPDFGVEAPSGGLFGGAAIVNPMAGSMHSYDATAINGWNNSGYEAVVGEDISIHAEPGTVRPNLASGDQYEGLVFGEDGELLSSGQFLFGIDAVSYVLMHDTLMNEYTTEKGVSGETEWVVTFPTKRFYVNNQVIAYAPFTEVWDPVSDGDLATACEVVELNLLWDREERFEKPGDPCDPSEEVCDAEPPIVSPPPPGGDDDVEDDRVPFELCYETNVIRFGLGAELDDNDEIVDVTPDETEILGTPKGFYRNIDNEALGFESGWARIELDDYLEAVPLKDQNGNIYGYDYEATSRIPLGADGGDYLNGLPFIGFSVNRFANGFIPGAIPGDQDVLSSYGGLFKHKSSRKVGSDF